MRKIAFTVSSELCIILSLFICACSTISKSPNSGQRNPSAAVESAMPAALSNVIDIEGDQNDRSFQETLATIASEQTVLSLLPQPISPIKKLVIEGLGRSEFIRKSNTLAFAIDACNADTPQFEAVRFIAALHEFGHSIFEENFRILTDNLLAKTDPAIDKYWQLWVTPDGLEKAQAMNVDNRELALPFHELFADTVAVFMTRKPNAMSELFYACKGQSNVRDFSYQYPLKNWNAGQLGSGLSNGAHDALNPTRSYIWRVYTDRFKSDPSKRAYILLALMRASVQVVKELTLENITYKAWEGAYPQEALNKHLMNAISNELQQMKNADR